MLLFSLVRGVKRTGNFCLWFVGIICWCCSVVMFFLTCLVAFGWNVGANAWV